MFGVWVVYNLKAKRRVLLFGAHSKLVAASTLNLVVIHTLLQARTTVTPAVRLWLGIRRWVLADNPTETLGLARSDLCRFTGALEPFSEVTLVTGQIWESEGDLALFVWIGKGRRHTLDSGSCGTPPVRRCGVVSRVNTLHVDTWILFGYFYGSR